MTERGVFETALVADGEPVFFAEHFERYRAGCAFFGIEPVPDGPALLTAASELIRSKGARSGVLRWSAWTGPEGPGSRMEFGPLRPHLDKPAWSAALAPDRLPPAGPESAFKRLDRGIWDRALEAARTRGFDEALLADEDGFLVEGAISNLFCVRGGVLTTPPLASGPLPGIARKKVIELARALGRLVREESISPSELREADEIFVTNSLAGVKPLAAVDERPLAAPGPIALLLQSEWAKRFG